MNKQATIDAVTAALTGIETLGGYQEYRPPRWRRLTQRLFPSKPLERPDEPWAYTYVTTHWSWKDRLRILVSGRSRVEIVTVETENTRQCWAVHNVLPPGVE